MNAKHSVQSHITAGAAYLQPFLRQVHRRFVSICYKSDFGALIGRLTGGRVATICGEHTPRWETLAEKKLGARHFFFSADA